MKKGNLLLLLKMARNEIFPLRMQLERNVALASVVVKSILWHVRFGHLNFNRLTQKKMVIGLPPITNERKIYEGCIYGNIHCHSLLHLGEPELY